MVTFGRLGKIRLDAGSSDRSREEVATMALDTLKDERELVEPKIAS